MILEIRTRYATQRRRGLYTGKTKRVVWKTPSRYIA